MLLHPAHGYFTVVTHITFPCRYMKYLYPFECEKKGLSSPGELQAAIDSNRREGRRPSYTNSLYRYSPSPSSAPHGLLSSSSMQTTPTRHNGLSTSASPNLKRKTGITDCVCCVTVVIPPDSISHQNDPSWIHIVLSQSTIGLLLDF